MFAFCHFEMLRAKTYTDFLEAIKVLNNFPKKDRFYTVMKIAVIRPNAAPCLREMPTKQWKISANEDNARFW